MEIEPPVTLEQANNVLRKKFLISSIAAFILLLFFQKQEVQAANIEENKNTLEVQQVQPTEMIEQALPMEYTEEDVILLATVIYAEAGICDESEQFRVGNVVLNRVKDTEHNDFKNVNTIEGVIYQKGQFTSVGGKAWNRGPTEIQIEIAKELIEGKRVLPDNVVWFSKGLRYGEEYYTSDWHVFSKWTE